MGNNKTKHSIANCDNIAAVSSTTSTASMASNTPEDEEKEEKNYESFALLWLDVNVKKRNDNRMTQKKLREAVNYIKTFDTIEVFEGWLNRRVAMAKPEKFILIVSGPLGKLVVPQIHILSQLVAIYVYCIDKTNEMWTNEFEKIRAVLTDPVELVEAVKSNQHELEKLEDLTSLSISVFDPSSLAKPSETSSTGINGNFLWMQLFIEVLLRMNHSDEDRMELVKLCKQTNGANNSQLRIIEEFEETYQRSTVLWWYTRESCLYKMLNKALRSQDIDTLIAFRTFIADLYWQLKITRQETTNEAVTHVYRGQLISTEELDRIKSSIGRFVSMNSFLSTSLDRGLALFYMPSPGDILTNGLQAVLLEIEVNPSETDTKPYADISRLSYFETESEVLFMLGSIFKIESVENIHDTQTIRLKLCNDNDHHLKELSFYLKHKISSNPTLVSLGNLLGDMGEYEKAEKCYQRQSNELNNKNSYTAGCCYTGLGVIANMRGDYNSAVTYHKKALNINLTFPNNNGNIAGSYSNLASAFKYRKDYKKALEYYKKCLNIQQTMYGNENLEVAKTCANMGNLYGEQKRYDDALKYQSYALKIQQIYLPTDHFVIARTFGNVGVVYHKLKDYNKALVCYQKSLEILLKSLPETHRCLGLTYHNLGEVYEDTDELNLAYENYVKADTVYRHSLLPTHSEFLENQQYLERVTTKLRKS